MMLKITLYKLLFLLCFLLIGGCSRNDDPQGVVYRKKNVVIIGSSTAAGAGATNYSYSWVGLLQSATQDIFINNAVSGYTTFHFLPEARSNSLGIVPDVKHNISASLNLKPDLIIFAITTNDIAKGFSIEDYMANMKIMTDLCEDNNVEFLVSSTQPRSLTYNQKLALLAINEKLEVVYGENYFDFYTPLCNFDVLEYKSDVDSGDHVHPNDKGHKIIFEVVFPFYVKFINKKLVK